MAKKGTMKRGHQRRGDAILGRWQILWCKPLIRRDRWGLMIRLGFSVRIWPARVKKG